MNAETLVTDSEHAGSPGLSCGDAAERLRRDGPNELPQERRRTMPRIVVEAVREPMLQLLLAAGLIYLVLGDLAEALVLLAFAMLNVCLVVAQESRTERALAALKDLTSPQALVNAGRHASAHSRQRLRGGRSDHACRR